MLSLELLATVKNLAAHIITTGGLVEDSWPSKVENPGNSSEKKSIC
jgi:hypothetical protein